VKSPGNNQQSTQLMCFFLGALRKEVPSKKKSTLLFTDLPKLNWVVVSFFNVQPYLGKWSNLTHIFQMGWNHQPVFIDVPKVSHSHIEAARRKEKYVVPLEHVSEWRPPCKWEQIVCSLNHAFRAGFWAKKNWSSNYWKIKREKISLKNLSSGKRTALLFLKDESWGKL